LRIATRRSPLALWQAEHVAGLLEAANPGLTTELVALETNADQRLDITIAELGGKGAFAKEIQAQVLLGNADIAVHSGKDLQAVTPEGLAIGAVPERGNPLDVLVGASLATWERSCHRLANRHRIKPTSRSARSATPRSSNRGHPRQHRQTFVTAWRIRCHRDGGCRSRAS
ncbi:UNVERIFIED_CONTAM: hypothetical protein GTU68_017736, partial [Idotea baltica]|nr:hypothetical protein [Idotea baltica]